MPFAHNYSLFSTQRTLDCFHYYTARRSLSITVITVYTKIIIPSFYLPMRTHSSPLPEKVSSSSIAEILDISPNFISEIETGKRWVSSDTLVNFAEVLGVEVYELLKPPQAPEDELSAFIQSYTEKAGATASEAVLRSLDTLRKQYII